MHRDMKADLQAFPAATPGAEQRACDRWRQEFNHVRPHEALGGKVPAEVYKPSERRFVRVSYVYPSDWIVRTVTDRGAINVRCAQFSAGLALARQRVGLEPIDGLRHRLWFRELDLGIVELPVPNTDIDAAADKHLAHRGVASNRAA